MPESEELNPTKIDRRILRTRQSLRTALMALVKEKDYDQVSVEEIAERANVSRATFYLHFKDKEDLLLEEFSFRARERVQELSDLPAARWFTNPETGGTPSLPLQAIFEHALENEVLYRILLRGGSPRRMSEGIRRITSQAINDLVASKVQGENLPLQAGVPVDLLGAYLSGALVNTLGWWLEQEPRMSVEEITRLFQQLFFPGVIRVFGLENLFTQETG